MLFRSESFGVKDPQFGLDVGFYAFDLPFWRFVLNLLFVIVVVAFVIAPRVSAWNARNAPPPVTAVDLLATVAAAPPAPSRMPSVNVR